MSRPACSAQCSARGAKAARKASLGFSRDLGYRCGAFRPQTPVIERGPVPVWLHLANLLRAQIGRGELRPGQMVPSITRLAAEHARPRAR